MASMASLCKEPVYYEVNPEACQGMMTFLQLEHGQVQLQEDTQRSSHLSKQPTLPTFHSDINSSPLRQCSHQNRHCATYLGDEDCGHILLAFNFVIYFVFGLIHVVNNNRRAAEQKNNRLETKCEQPILLLESRYCSKTGTVGLKDIGTSYEYC